MGLVPYLNPNLGRLKHGRLQTRSRGKRFSAVSLRGFLPPDMIQAGGYSFHTKALQTFVSVARIVGLSVETYKIT
jgi:hypothetical protein